MQVPALPRRAARFVAAVPEAALSAPSARRRRCSNRPKSPPPRPDERLGEARDRRENAACVRQGEWFFLPGDGMTVDERLVLWDEPLRRGNGGKPHSGEFCYRTGAQPVSVIATFRPRR